MIEGGEGPLTMRRRGSGVSKSETMRRVESGSQLDANLAPLSRFLSVLRSLLLKLIGRICVSVASQADGLYIICPAGVASCVPQMKAERK